MDGWMDGWMDGCPSTPPHPPPPPLHPPNKHHQVHIKSPGGHSSMPPTDGSSVGDVMGRVLSRLTTAPPAPRLVAPVTDMLHGLAPYASGRVLVAAWVVHGVC